MIDIVRFTYSDQNLASISMAIREAVFVKEQGVSATLEYDGLDEAAVHYLLFEDNNPIGTARWRETAEGIKLERFALLPQCRNKGTGSELLKRVMSDVLAEKKKIYLHAQEKAVGYYLRAGFEAEGPLFVEANINHYKMVYKGI